MEQPDPVQEPSPQEKLDDVVHRLSQTLDADFYLFSSGILDINAGTLIELVRARQEKRTHAALVLTTNGGSADAAFQIARAIKRHYTKLFLYVFGYCKSAGTLIAIAADEIVMSEFGQFGPLDVQLVDKTEMFGQTPALDVSQALQTLSEAAFNFFTDHFFKLGPGRGVPTASAIEMAKDLTLGVIEPIAAQIDPLLLGRVDRSMRIAEEYSARLNPQFKEMKRLVAGYPSHEFVIDYEEAKSLFSAVRPPTQDECEAETMLRYFGCVPNQSDRPTILCLSKSVAASETPHANEPPSTESPDSTHSSVPNGTDNPRKANRKVEQKPAGRGDS